MTAERKETSLEQSILEAAEKCERGVYRGEYDFFHASDIKALLKEKKAEIERLGNEMDLILRANDRVLAVYGELERERDEWKRIAGEFRREHVEWGCITSGNEACSPCKSHDALTGKGKP